MHRATDGGITSAVKKQTFEVGKKNYSLDISKANQIFDALLVEKLIRLNGGHKIPMAEDLKGKDFCKWHTLWCHSTNN